jgi:hypothetical protein
LTEVRVVKNGFMQNMSEWPAWQRWGLWLFGWALSAGVFWLLISANGLIVRLFAIVLLCAAMLLLAYSSRAVLNERMRAVDRRRLRMVLPALVVYMLLMLYVWPMQEHIVQAWLKAVVALLPMVPMVFVILAMVRYLSRCDELERQQYLQAAGIAAATVSLVSMALGFLAGAGVIHVDGALALLLVFPALCTVYGSACAWSKWRNRAR